MDDSEFELNDEELVESGDEDDFHWPQLAKPNEPPWLPYDIVSFTNYSEPFDVLESLANRKRFCILNAI